MRTKSLIKDVVAFQVSVFWPLGLLGKSLLLLCLANHFCNKVKIFLEVTSLKDILFQI